MLFTLICVWILSGNIVNISDIFLWWLDFISFIFRSLSLVTRLYFIHIQIFLCWLDCISSITFIVVHAACPKCELLMARIISYSLFREALLTWSLFPTSHFSCNSCDDVTTCSRADTTYIHKRLHHANDVMSITLSLLFRLTAAKFSNLVQKKNPPGPRELNDHLLPSNAIRVSCA